jgi:hypothetical protein
LKTNRKFEVEEEEEGAFVGTIWDMLVVGRDVLSGEITIG